MKLAIIGSEGYVGRAMQRLIEQSTIPVTTIKHDIFVYNQREGVSSPVNNEENPVKIAEWINDHKVDAVIWLAAYAHDPRRYITEDEHIRNNSWLPLQVYDRTDCRFVIPSSLSVHSQCSYALSKRLLEQALVRREDFARRGHIFRFGTLYGVVDLLQDPESFRSHLVLNSMCFTATNEGVIRVNGGQLSRPVLPVHVAASQLLRCAVEVTQEPGPAGTIHNSYETCGTLTQFADIIQEVANELGHPAVIETDQVVDPRNYGWGKFNAQLLRPSLFATIRWLEKNILEVSRHRQAFPSNLYNFVKDRRAV